MKKIFIFNLIFGIFAANSLWAQVQSCEVMVEAIKGSYDGDCVSGKANGYGKSVGKDTYEGVFKGGYPDGTGKYTWSNKNYYKGDWKKGKMDGNGELHYMLPGDKDSTVTGFWKKDRYLGLYEKRFQVVTITSKINRVDCSLADKTGENLLITVHRQVSSDNNSVALPVPFVSEISPITGTFYTSNNQVLTNSSVTRVQQVTFPFKAIFYLSNGEYTQIAFNEKGSYDLYFDLQ